MARRRDRNAKEHREKALNESRQNNKLATENTAPLAGDH